MRSPHEMRQRKPAKVSPAQGLSVMLVSVVRLWGRNEAGIRALLKNRPPVQTCFMSSDAALCRGTATYAIRVPALIPKAPSVCRGSDDLSRYPINPITVGKAVDQRPPASFKRAFMTVACLPQSVDTLPLLSHKLQPHFVPDHCSRADTSRIAQNQGRRLEGHSSRRLLRTVYLPVRQWRRAGTRGATTLLSGGRT
jgi:hypothetical protein